MNLANTATEETIKKNSKLIARVTDLMVQKRCNSESEDEIATRYQTNTDPESLKKEVPVGFIDEVDLLDKMSQAFNLSEVKQLCFYLQIDFEDIPGDKKSDKIREVIVFLRRRDRLYELVNVCRKYRKNIRW